MDLNVKVTKNSDLRIQDAKVQDSLDILCSPTSNYCFDLL